MADQSSVEVTGKNLYCTVDASGELSVFYCADGNTKEEYIHSVDPLLEREIIQGMKEENIDVVDSVEYFKRNFKHEMEGVSKLGIPPVACFERVGYKTSEFTALPQGHKTIMRVQELVSVLKEAGVCSIDVEKESYLGIDIKNNDDVLEHFLCISNNESTFGNGRDNIGDGGRGPFGINPIHNDEPGDPCYPGQAVRRDSRGRELKDYKLYLNRVTRLANARCAIELYKRKGFTDWSETRKWGSNRHCDRDKKKRFNFSKYLGAEMCCTSACRAKFEKAI